MLDDEMLEELAYISGEDVDTMRDMFSFEGTDNNDYIVIGESPYGEDCAQLNTNSPAELGAFHRQNRDECKVLIEQMQRTTLKDFKYKDKLFIKKNNYEESYYEDVCYKFEVDNESETFINFVEESLPEFWDEESKNKLGIK